MNNQKEINSFKNIYFYVDNEKDLLYNPILH